MANITLVHDCDIERRPDPDAVGGDFRDTRIDGASPTTNFDGAWLWLGIAESAGKYYQRRGLFHYDLKAFIPAGATIIAAVLHFYVFDTDTTVDQAFQAVRIRRDWVEDEATWNVWKTGSNWTTAGAEHLADDRDINYVVALGALNTTGWKTATMTALVQDAWTSENGENGVVNFIVERHTLPTQGGLVEIPAKWTPGSDYYHLVHHLRITYTLDGRTFQALVH